MKKLILLLFLLPLFAGAQTYQSMPQAGYGPVKRMLFDSVLTLPLGITKLQNISGGRDVGQIRYNVIDSSIYTYSGTRWIKSGIDTSTIYYNLGLKLNISDTANMMAAAPRVQRFLDSVANLKSSIDLKLNKTDTASLSNRINLKVNITDTAAMLAPYTLTTTTALKLNIADTAAMLTPYTRATQTALKLNISDTASMLSAYTRLTANALKLNISDTASMLTPYLRKVDTTNKFITSVFRKTASDSVFFVKGGTNNFAFKDSAGGANIGNSNLTLTGTRTLTNAGYQLSFLGGFESAVNFQNALKLETSTTAKESIELELNNTYTSTGKRFRFRNLAAGYMDLIGAANNRIMTFNSTPFVTVGATVTRISDAMFSVYGSIATSQGMQITGSITSPTGSGIELENQGGTTYFTSYNRAGSWLPSIFRCGELNIQNGGTQSAKVYTTGNWVIQTGGSYSDRGYKLQVTGTAEATQFKISALNTAPASATATGVLGEVRITAGFIYVCTATNTWVRTALTTW